MILFLHVLSPHPTVHSKYYYLYQILAINKKIKETSYLSKKYTLKYANLIELIEIRNHFLSKKK